jgi:pimeloyl-ACP methyl ester carboxylesterase
MGKTLTPFIFIADIGGAVVRAPINWATSLASHLNSSPRFESPGMRDALGGHHELALWRRAGSGDSIDLSIMGDRRSLGDEIHYTVTGLLTAPFKLAFLPLLDAIGTPAWNNMLRRTKMIFSEPFEEEIIMTPEEGRGALHLLARAISEESATASGEVQITLVGHSMGSIIANEFIRHYPDLHYDNIVYMAAACSIQDFRDTAVPYLADAERRGRGTQFYNLMLHPRAEVRERYFMVPPLGLDLAPRGSLLAWIDDIFGSQTTPLERTMGRWHNIMRLWQFIPSELRSRIHLKTFGVAGGEPLSELSGIASIRRLFSDSEHREWLGQNPQWHGDFSLMPWWDESFWTPGEECPSATSGICDSVSVIEALRMNE